MKSFSLQNKDLSLRLLTTGTKIASLVFKKNELLYTKTPRVYNPRLEGVFNEDVAWGGDICFPSVGKTEIRVKGKTYSIADHGNFWTRKFKIIKKTNDSISLLADDKFFLLKVLFKLRGHELLRTYTIKNISGSTLPYLFADHLLLPVDEKLPPYKYLNIPGVKTMLIEYSFGNKLGKKGEVVDWRKKRVRPFADKLFGQLVRGKAGFYHFAYERRIKDKKVLLSFSSPELPYIGYWHTEGGWKNEYNLGLEFTNEIGDELSKKTSSTLKVGAEKRFTVSLKIEE